MLAFQLRSSLLGMGEIVWNLREQVELPLYHQTTNINHVKQSAHFPIPSHPLLVKETQYSWISWNLRTVPTNKEVFLRGLRLRRKQILARAIEIQKEN